MRRYADSLEIDDVPAYRRKLLDEIEFSEPERPERRIATREKLLEDLGYSSSQIARESGVSVSFFAICRRLAIAGRSCGISVRVGWGGNIRNYRSSRRAPREPPRCLLT